MKERCSSRQLFKKTVIIIASLILLLSCSLPQVNSGSGKPAGMEETVLALRVQGTVEALNKDKSKEENPPAGKNLPEDQATAGAVQEQSTPENPTAPVEPTIPPPASETPTPVPTQDIEQMVQKANVLVFEDVRGYPDMEARVHAAVQNMGFSGGRVVEIGDAVGLFMEQLNSPTRWDLIVVSAEARNAVRGEFWDLIRNHVDQGVALVAELWYLDEIANGRIAPLLEECGVRFSNDWQRDPGYDQLDYSIYWLDQNHEVFSRPNLVGPLTTPNINWIGDAGDLIRLGAGGDAILLAGKYPDQKSSHGVLATCLGGRMILQTFCTHDYRRDHTVPLWENYMDYTLRNHFKAMQ